MTNNKNINHWCVLCGSGYHSCDTCSQERTATPWRSLTDTMEHYKIFMVLRDYHNQTIDQNTARNLLSECDLSDQETYKDSAKAVLSDIYTDNCTGPAARTAAKQPPKKKPRKAKAKKEPAAEEPMQTGI